MKAKPKNIEPTTSWVYYSPSFKYNPDCSMYFGDDKFGISLFFNFETSQFELDINPHGDKKGAPINNVNLSLEYSTFSFETTINGKCKAYSIHAQFETDKIIFRLFDQLHEKGISASLIKPNDNSLRLGLKNGMILEFDTADYDKNGKVIPLSGVNIRIQEFNSDGKPDNSENLLRTLPIVAEKFVFIERKGYLFHEIDKLYFNNDVLVTETKDRIFKSTFQTVPVIFDAVTKLVRHQEFDNA